MTSGSFEFEDRVVVGRSARTRSNGTAGWHGTIVGESYENDDPRGRILSYAVAMEEDEERVWMVEPEDIEQPS